MNLELIPFLTFENSKEALEYYKRVFGATDISRKSPTEKQAEEMALNKDINLDNLTSEAQFNVLGKEIWCADSFVGKPVVSTMISLMYKIDASDSAAVSAIESLYNKAVASEEVKVILALSLIPL